MISPDEQPKLRLAPSEPVEETRMRLEREQRAENLMRESELENSLAPFRVGSVPYLNAVPLTRGLEDQIIFETPSRLAEMLRAGELDAALVSLAAVLFEDRYDILDGIAIASLGEVQSVLMAHRIPLEQIQEVFVDTASVTSVALLKVLLAERGLYPRFTPMDSYKTAPEKDAVLLIGDPALDFLRAQHPHQIYDLGTAWMELTRLPFVYAVWALQRGAPNEKLRRQLRSAKEFGLDTLDYIVQSRTEYDYNFRKDYLSWHVHYHLAADEKRGVNKFMELLRKHGLGPVYEPHYVQ
jgi:predicted solute-binding protein